MAQFLDDPAYPPAFRNAVESAAVFRSLQEADAARAKALVDAETRKQNQIENEKIIAQAKADTAKERAADEKKRLAEQRSNLEAGIRQQFFTANPEASESDFQNVKQRLLDEHFVARALKTGDAVAAVRAGADYTPM